jgi:hypothetical protein
MFRFFRQNIYKIIGADVLQDAILLFGAVNFSRRQHVLMRDGRRKPKIWEKGAAKVKQKFLVSLSVEADGVCMAGRQTFQVTI